MPKDAITLRLKFEYLKNLVIANKKVKTKLLNHKAAKEVNINTI